MKTLLIIDDHRIIFEGLEARLKTQFELYYASNSASAVEIALTRNIYAAIIDVSLGEGNGFDLAYDIRKAVPQIFFFSMHKSPHMVRKALADGYDGYFLKDETVDELIRALTTPEKGRFWMTDSVKKLLDAEIIQGDQRYDSLTAREQQIFRMIAEGKKAREIAGQLNISTKTISVHRENLMRKMNLESNADIVRVAIKLEIIES